MPEQLGNVIRPQNIQLKPRLFEYLCFEIFDGLVASVRLCRALERVQYDVVQVMWVAKKEMTQA
ncbi:hypothetical protein [Pseudomonas syringae group genomosp. 3]|uniref:hypothetical protein n=1 Tax=Pseudomonas syringae group genomosp. 3 TaxID=251701 RepID=UPI0021801BE6|nr:hypothetical protein [Pseudomonas syringae group genomosp. 3]